MNESALLIKSKKRILIAALFSLLLVGIATVVNLSSRNEQINKITRDLVGNTYSYSDRSKYHKGEYKYTFYEGNKVIQAYNSVWYGRNSDGSDKYESGEFQHQYSVNVPILGAATVGYGNRISYSVEYDEKGIAQLKSGETTYTIQGRLISGQISPQRNEMGVFWMLVLGISIAVTAIPTIDYLRILRSIRKAEEDEQQQIAEAENSAALARENDRKNTIKSFWEDSLSVLGYKANEAILSNGDIMWIANQCLYQTKPFSDYLKSYDGENDVHQLVKKMLSLIIIPVANIQYFAKEGDVQYTTNISGGGGGGYSITGAIVGGIIAGDAGAVIGSRKKINDVISKTEMHDNRRTILRYYKGNSLEIMNFNGFAVYDFLLRNVPEKDLLTIQLQVQNVPVEVESISNVKERLQALKGLHDDGLINDHDYEEKKNQLLQKL